MHVYNNYYKKILLFLMYKNERKNIHFDDKKIKKSDFYKKKKKKMFIIADADVNKILVSKKEPMAKSLKYFIEYNDNDVIRPLCLKFSKMTSYINEFNENKNTIIVSLKVNDEQLSKKYNKI